MKINLKKLGKIQEEFRLGNIGEFTAWNIKNLLDGDGNLTLSSILETVENSKSFKVKIGGSKLEDLTKKERMFHII